MAETLKGIMEKAVKKYREVYASAFSYSEVSSMDGADLKV